MPVDSGYRRAAKEAGRNISAVVEVLMVVHHKSQGDVAQVLGLQQPSLSERLRGKTRWTAEEVAVLSRFFDVPAGVFFEGSKRFLEAVHVPLPPEQLVLEGIAA